FVSAIDLKAGDRLNARDQSKNGATVTTLELVQQQGRTHNLTVDVGHTFFVGKFETWVHNVGPCAECSNGFCTVHTATSPTTVSTEMGPSVLAVPGTGGLDLTLSKRHLLGSLGMPKATGNSLFLGPRAEAVADVAEIRSGVAVRDGNFFTTSSGRVWERHDSSVHPVSGPGVVDVSSREYNILVMGQKQGIDKAIYTTGKQLENGVISPEAAERALGILDIMRKKINE
ncbi:hypothetical protein RBA41_33275, partial [Massilia sp. CCM 9210]|uniref:hypothetical protein n=1 Tax=Massilia scottii TaxID=3057166 RepID=UPI0027968D3F